MKLSPILTLIAGAGLLCSCHGTKSNSFNDAVAPKQGTFGYDVDFLRKKDSLVLLRDSDGVSEVIVSPRYQGKIFTSTAEGDTGKSFGWINYKAFDAPVDPHMNAYGGEDRLWLGPEGGKFALFFKKGAKMEFANWVTPAPFDHASWKVTGSNDHKVTLTKDMSLVNYKGTRLDLKVERRISLLERTDIEKVLKMHLDSAVKVVGIETDNSITNTGKDEWTKQTGAPCLWNLDMFTPSPQSTIVIPYNEKAAGKVATTDYFGQIPANRVITKKGHLFFKADGKSRGKLGMAAARTLSVAGSYDAANNVLSIILFDVDRKATYLNQEWKTDKDPLIGDAVNAYNDGPLAKGSQLGPFYEIESVSPGAFLMPDEKLTHQHFIFHFTGDKAGLNSIASKILGVSLADIQSAFK
ncbi:MAG TPA: DUF6786 family protein [Mucilaginibacter sp.]|jgi:hypothetical protein|nr:DUF6786 family protein [Mucilaginibacter sp.]